MSDGYRGYRAIHDISLCGLFAPDGEDTSRTSFLERIIYYVVVRVRAYMYLFLVSNLSVNKHMP